MNIKMIVTDLDGTFYHRDLTYDKKRFNQLYGQMKDHDIKFVVASGNQYFQLISFFDDFQNMSFIAENGSYIVSEGQEIFLAQMNKNTYLHVVQLLMNIEGIEFTLICGKKSSYVLSSTPDELCHFFQNYFPKMEKVESFAKIDDDIMKISLVVQEDLVDSIEKQLQEAVDDQLKVVTSGHGCIDIIIKGADKGHGIAMLMDKWNINADEIMAFGDAMNDLEMLELVKYGFVMANGNDVLKEKIGCVLPYTNEEDGELLVIDKYFENPIECESLYKQWSCQKGDDE